MRRALPAAIIGLMLAGLILPVLAQEHGGGGAEHGSAKTEHGEGASHGPSTALKWANLAILAAVLGYIISKNAGTFFRSRTEQIQREIREATRMRVEAEARAAGMEKRMQNLGAELESLRRTAREEIASEGESVRQETARLLARMQEHAEQEIAASAKQARQELKAYSAELALNLARRKIESRLTPDAQGALVESFARDLGRRVN